ncbi:hypothetical protein ORV05_29780 [Amycolatopsis cynarae]|uniref:Uncharacterized protein n=1 Tax=Amycolatopsis cynarae TaxID=2995223 RepID=A0ABY7AZG5_9PSEU|nr:hypothetical protein [Amycolatopsis sp. HUAS 11-8]WAL65067.1 hypothetical protein ORV05_29780 [Amycolatopsis sp. HUAS 11-8]
MRVVHDRRRSRQAPDALTVEDLLAAQDLALELVESEYLTESVRESRKFLPPSRLHVDGSAASREPESRLAKIAKLAGLSTAASLLVGAVVASALLTRGRPADSGRATSAPPPITGAAALGGFITGGDTGSTATAPLDGYGNTVLAPQIPVAATHQTRPDGQAADSPAGKLAVVAEFYQRMGSPQPEDALSMLVPSLAGNEPGRLIRAWASMKEIHVEQTSVQPDGSVRAVVGVVQRNGTKLRVTQVLTLASNAPNVISQAQLLSAEQL